MCCLGKEGFVVVVALSFPYIAGFEKEEVVVAVVVDIEKGCFLY